MNPGSLTSCTWVLAGHVSQLVPLKKASGLGLRSRAARELLVEIDDSGHAGCVGRAANGLQNLMSVSQFYRNISFKQDWCVGRFERVRGASRGVRVGQEGGAEDLRSAKTPAR